MAREIEEYEEVKSFIQDVTEQIQYRPIRREIKEELLSHIEDRVDEYENAGDSRDNAIKNTVLQMGEPINIGMSLNSVRRTRENWWGIGFGIIAIMLAVLGCMREWSEKGFVYGLFRTFYLPLGLVLFVFFYLKGYEILVKKTKVILYILCGIIALEAIIFLLRKLSIVTQYNVFSRRIYPILFSPSVVGSILLVIVPLIVIVIYGIRLRGKLAIWLAYITMELFLILSGLHLGFRIVTNELIAIFTLIIVLGIMIGKDILKGKMKQLWIWYCIGAVSLLGSYGVINNTLPYASVSYNVERFMNPDSVEHDEFDYAYDSITIRDLLSKAKPFGSVTVSQEDLNAIQSKAEDGVAIRYPVTKKDNFIKDTLPQYYNKNYRIAYWIIKYGWIIGGALIAVVAAFFISLTVMSARIKNQLAKMLSISCSICLLLQFIFYLLSNLGYLYGNSVNLPLISDGLCSIIVNTILFACILGAYRYDHVWNHWDYRWKITS
ncbi:cell division protein FtsW, lipid II flippase [Anaerosporobacter mobilis DSM 15930]|uniref:Cell division protein FtsW, lipid II flippase n=1 Tax=Anaerosporobacter mobilis DSM 15930 TaxID=1120996 RepID=A0A1M7KN08_9FIRM|nr:permease prefix domain 1-containing protein [Anaerosporobacter mobilis]SHM66785.1 cell division protein FtsW, lipid II flippase [Anaerosporobacter mobilis DSM 15930]